MYHRFLEKCFFLLSTLHSGQCPLLKSCYASPYASQPLYMYPSSHFLPADNANNTS